MLKLNTNFVLFVFLIGIIGSLENASPDILFQPAIELQSLSFGHTVNL